MEKIKRIILMGHGASGKDYARKLFENFLGLKYGVSYTTRPPREGEVEGKDYYFITKERFQEMIDKNLWYEYVEFNGWLYGTTKEQFYNQDNLFIMTPKGLSHLSETDRNESSVIYFDIPENIRKERMIQRKGNADSVERRLIADKKDFSDITEKDYDYRITSPNFTIEDLENILKRNLIEA